MAIGRETRSTNAPKQQLIHPLFKAMIYTIEQQADNGSWKAKESFEDKGLAEKELMHLNALLINGKPFASHRITTTPVTQRCSALDNTELISEAQWAKLARLSLNSGLSVETMLGAMQVEFNEESPDDQQNLIGRIPVSAKGWLHGLLHWTGSTHT